MSKIEEAEGERTTPNHNNAKKREISLENERLKKTSNT